MIPRPPYQRCCSSKPKASQKRLKRCWTVESTEAKNLKFETRFISDSQIALCTYFVGTSSRMNTQYSIKPKIIAVEQITQSVCQQSTNLCTADRVSRGFRCVTMKHNTGEVSVTRLMSICALLLIHSRFLLFSHTAK